ncbi:MAG TPA: pyridoxal-phosphate dependent enzyme [Nordella sp.]|nr:pyridoxal-phosphate dependent enzyme [Nordella sp.]
MGLVDHLPRAPLGHFPTPLDPAPRLSAALGGPRILIKREDLSGLSAGGSKTRIFEFVLGDAKAEGATAVVASAGEQSNKLREVAAGANKLGMKPILLLTGISGPPQMTGNRFLFEVLGADIHTTPIADRLDPKLRAELVRLCDTAAAEGHKPYLIYHPEKSGTIGTAAYMSCADELVTQFAALAEKPKHLFVTAGATPTIAGLTLGLRALGQTIGVTGVAVSAPSAVLKAQALSYAKKCADHVGLDRTLGETDITIDDSHHVGTPAPATPAVIAAIEIFARTEGILLEPTYTGKAAAGMIDAIRRGAFKPSDTIVFVHTGGLPGLFARIPEFNYA